MIIDFHAHPLFTDWMPGEERTEPRAPSEALVQVARRMVGLPPAITTLDDFIAQARAAGIERTVIFDKNNEASTGEPLNNDWVADLAAAHPNDLIAFMALDPLPGIPAARVFEAALRDGRVRGGKIHPYFAGMPPNDPRCYPFYEVAQDAGVPIIFHQGPGGVGAGMTTKGIEVSHPRYLADVAMDFPRLKVVIAHFAGPFFWEAHTIAWRFPSVSVDLSGYPLSFLKALPWELFEETIPLQIMFGSDYPIVSPARRLAELEQLPVSDETRAAIAGGNATRLLGL
jgi:predicted TIM-barrel fold metal-dependent hydrolase